MSLVVRKRVRIANRSGLHVRAATQLARYASDVSSRISIIKDGESVDATSLIGILALGIEYDSEVEIEVAGEDSEGVLATVEELFASRFGEEH